MPFGDNRENFRVVIEERSPVEVGKKPCMYVCLAYPLRCFYLVDPGGRDVAGWTVDIDALRPGGGVELGGSPVVCLLGSCWLVQK